MVQMIFFIGITLLKNLFIIIHSVLRECNEKIANLATFYHQKTNTVCFGWIIMCFSFLVHAHMGLLCGRYTAN